MPVSDQAAPSAADFERIAAKAFQALPDVFRSRCADLVIRIAEFAEPAILEEMGIADPFELTGLYEGTALTEKSTMDLPHAPDIVWLYRRPILDEWAARGDLGLERLIAHVLIHEIAHHFGYTDAEIAAIDDWRS